MSTAFAARSSGPAGADLASGDPYGVTAAVDTNPAPDIFETTLVARTATLDIGNGTMANVWTFNGTLPGPEIRIKVGDTLITHFRNELPLPSGIHWHGLELNNQSDGSALTQNAVPPGGTHLYRFVASRPGVFWYHPHHRPTNQVFRGMYAPLIVEDPHDDTLVANGVLPPRVRTRSLMLSDTTVCKAPGTNDSDTYDDSLPWVGGPTLPEQAGPFPTDLCDRPMDDHGTPIRDANGRPVPLQAGDIPNIQKATGSRTVEGQTVLANGRNRGARSGSPQAPGALAPTATAVDIAAGQGVRLQAINAATSRYFRLRLTDSAGRQIPLVRVGGEGGLLDYARIEGGRIGGIPEIDYRFDTEYARSELVLAPSDRSDFVVAVPRDAPIGVATLWTLDYSRVGEGFSKIPTVPVMHLNVTAPTAETYTLAEGAPLRTHAAVNDPVEALGPPPDPVSQLPASPLPALPDTTGSISPLLDPATFSPPKPGSANEDIRFVISGGAPTIDAEPGQHDAGGPDYRTFPHVTSTRYAKLGDLLELTVTNISSAHHAFHLHGFSFQPLAFERFEGPDYTFDYHEFVDTIDVPSNYKFRFRVRLDDRPLMDGITPGGGVGRWVFHCHILFHAALGMMAELVVVAPDGNERPFVDADTTSVTVDQGGISSATGTFNDPDGDGVTLTASTGTVTDIGGGRWSWRHDPSTDGPVESSTVYVTATDSDGLRGQAAFDVNVRNVPPTVTVTSPASGTAYPVGSRVTVTASVTDPGGPEGLACRFDWDDGAGAGAPIPAVGGSCGDTRTLAQVGVYTVVVTGSDGEGSTASDSTMIAVYDPAAGFVTGQGTISSPAGAYPANPALGGPAVFDFKAKYHANGTVPTGSTLFVFQAALLDFQATSLDWLVVSGAKAQYRGSGTIGGVGGFDFLLTAVDGMVAGGGGIDRFRLKVWDRAHPSTVVYDNAIGSPDDIDAAAPPPIATGDIEIHAR